MRGNHDAYRHQTYAPEGPQRIDVDGLTLALLDTTIPGHTTGQVPDEQLEWLEDLAAEADRPVLVLGHHHVWNPGASASGPTTTSASTPTTPSGSSPPWPGTRGSSATPPATPTATGCAASRPPATGRGSRWRA